MQNDLIRALLNFRRLPIFPIAQGSWQLKNSLLWKLALLFKLSASELNDELRTAAESLLKIIPDGTKVYSIYTALLTFMQAGQKKSQGMVSRYIFA